MGDSINDSVDGVNGVFFTTSKDDSVDDNSVSFIGHDCTGNDSSASCNNDFIGTDNDVDKMLPLTSVFILFLAIMTLAITITSVSSSTKVILR